MFDLPFHLEAEGLKRLHIQTHVKRGVSGEIIRRELKEAGRRAGPSAVLWVSGPESLFLEMHESARDLDQPLKEAEIACLFIGASLEPEIFQDIMGLIIKLLIEALEEAEIAGVHLGVHLPVGSRAELGDKFGDPFGLFHL